MFGHQNSDDNSNVALPAPDMVASHEPTTIAPTAATSAPVVGGAPDAGSYAMADIPGSAPATSPSTPPVVSSAPSVASAPAPAPAGVTQPTSANLLDLKQSALHELSPLIGHLEQSPEEKFRTTMMMIQASDDQSMLPTAFAAAKQIKDEKARAQALLDVVNEINYFTQQHGA